jgi:hypothetical protein
MKTTTGMRAMMNGQVTGSGTHSQLPGISLQILVNQLLSNSMTTAFQNKSLVINEVSREVLLPKEKTMIAPVIRDLLAAVISNSKNGQIYISAERFRDMIILQVQERNNNNGYALSSSLAFLEAEAIVAGGNLEVNGAQKKIVTISLSFPVQNGLQYDC